MLTSCASIYNGSSNVVTVYSTPDKANFTVTNEAGVKVHNGITPTSVKLNNGTGYFDGEKYSIKYSKEGYLDAQAVIDSSISRWYWGNFFFGGLIGFLAVDPATGGMYELPKTISASLTKNTTP